MELVQIDEALAHQRIQAVFKKFSETINSYGGFARCLTTIARVRVERKCGQLLKESVKAKGNQNTEDFGGHNKQSPNPPKTLSEIGFNGY